MAIQISGNTVINDSRALHTGLLSAYGTVSSGGNTTITNRTLYYVTSDATQVFLPTTVPPTSGNEVVIVSGGTFGSVAVSPGGSYKIMGQAAGEVMTIDIPYASVRLIYLDDIVGWIIA